MHDNLQQCKDNNYINISTWLKNKLNTSKILLEEVNKNNIILKELWGNAKHTQELKKLYFENSDKIIPVDIRYILIPFSIELYINDNINIKLCKYIKDINNFFSLKLNILKLNCYNLKYLINNQIGDHFLFIKKNYKKFIIKYKKFLNNNLYDLNILELIKDINILLDNIMEWYICACLFEYNNNSIIIHVGLAHSEKIIYYLNNFYNCFYEKEYGINKLINSKNGNENGCLFLPIKYNILF